MADEIKKEEAAVETTEENTEALNAAIEAGDETEADDKEAETLETMKEFDDKIDSEDDDSAGNDDGEEEAAKEEAPAKEEAAKATSEDDSINAAADDLEKEMEAESKKSDEQKATEKAEADQKAADEAAAKAKETEEEKPFDCGLSTDEDSEGNPGYEPALVETLNKQGQAVQDRAKAAEKANEVLSSKLDQQSAQRNADWLDGKFNGLGENFDDVLGKGEFDDLEPGSDQRANRIAVSKRMGVTIDAYVKAEKAIPTRTKLFDMAVDKLFNKETNQPKTDKETIAKAGKRAAQTLGTGSKKASTVSAAQKALQVQKDFDAKIDA